MPRCVGAGGVVAGSLGVATGAVVVVVVVEVVVASAVPSAARAAGTAVSATPATISPIANLAVFMAAHRESDCFE